MNLLRAGVATHSAVIFSHYFSTKSATFRSRSRANAQFKVEACGAVAVLVKSRLGVSCMTPIYKMAAICSSG